MIRFLIYLRSRNLGMISIIILVLLYLLMIFAEFAAPYGPNKSFPEHTYHPPNLRFYQGKFQAQKCAVINTVNWSYARIKGEYEVINFFAKGESYKLWGIIPMDRYLFNTGGDQNYPIFLMGADNLGRDVFSRIIYGSRISLTIGFIATAISLLLAALFGGLSGYFGGKTDWTIMRAAEFFMLIPGLYLILFLRSLLTDKMDPGQTYMMITIILSLVGWPGLARTIRGMVHSIKREEFVQNAQLEMIPPPAIIFKYIIPQIASLLTVSVALSIPGFIMTETILSYLGLGISDPAVSWGSLINREISTIVNLRAYPWLLNPVWFLLLATLSFNFLGDCLRDYYDPYHAVFRRRKWSAGRKDKAEINNTFHSTVLKPPLLEVQNLAVSFKALRGKEQITVQAVRGVSFKLEYGETLGIVGESGSGKSVSVLTIPGLLPKNAFFKGSVKWDGKEIINMGIEELRQYRGKKIGMIFQEPGRSYDPLQNIGNVFLETFRNSEPLITKEEALKRADVLLAEAGLQQSAGRLANFPHQFSGGQLQRIGIALALAQNCELLIADEPTTALDMTIQKQIMDLLKELRRTRNLSVIFISHNLDLVSDIADRIIVMYGGLIMESGPAGKIAEAPLHPYTKALLQSTPQFGSHYSDGHLQSISGKIADPSKPEPGCPFAPRCQNVMEICYKKTPSVETTGNHSICCWLYIGK